LATSRARNAGCPAPLALGASFLGGHTVVALSVAPAVESRHAEPRPPREERTMATSCHAPPKFETVLYEKTGPICFITLNRPEKLHPANDQLVDFRESAPAFVEKRKPVFKGR
jgi:hypothetical protein